MPYMVRYAGSRSGRFKPIKRERVIVDLRVWMPAEKIGDAMERLEKGERVRTRAATYYYTDEEPLTEEQIAERLRDAVNKGARLIGRVDGRAN